MMGPVQGSCLTTPYHPGFQLQQTCFNRSGAGLCQGRSLSVAVAGKELDVPDLIEVRCSTPRLFHSRHL